MSSPVKIIDYEREAARLMTVIANALNAMDEGRYGDARRWLRDGDSPALRATSNVIAFNGGPRA